MEIDSKKAIQTEKAVFRYRLYMIKCVAISRIKEMRIQAKIIYNKLEEWNNYTNKVENEAVFELVNLK